MELLEVKKEIKQSVIYLMYLTFTGKKKLWSLKKGLHPQRLCVCVCMCLCVLCVFIYLGCVCNTFRLFRMLINNTEQEIWKQNYLSENLSGEWFIWQVNKGWTLIVRALDQTLHYEMSVWLEHDDSICLVAVVKS